jgi:sodium transport system permease protein
MGPLMSSLGIEGMSGLSVSWMAALGILVLLVPLSALFSALSLSLSTLARSVKEAQHYLTPMFLLVMPLAMVVVIPNIPLTPTLAAVPITNVVLFFRDLLLGKLEVVTTLIVIASTAVFAALALFVSVTLFLREETLFRGPEGTGSLLTRPAPRRVPTASAAVFLFAGALAMMWYAQPLLPADDLIRAAVTVQFALLLAPCLLLAWWLRVHPVHTFRLRLPHPSALLLALPVGLTVPIANSALQRALFDDTIEPGAFKELGERFEEAISSNSPLLLVLVLAVLPTVVEELFFRGFVLSALRGAFRGRAALARALFVTALLFALFHIYPEKWLATGTVGLILAVIAVRTGSIWPCMLVHALNNGSLVLYARMQRDWTLAAPVYSTG